MNEKILKLALDAGVLNYVDNETPRRYFVHGFADVEDVEQFAELVVRECINCIENTDKGYIFTAKDAGIVNAAHTRSMKKVKEHFGVE